MTGAQMTDPALPIGAALADAWRIAFLTAGVPVIGAVVLLAIASVAGARWDALGAIARAAPWLVPVAVLLGPCQLMTPPPAHLALWLSWWAVTLRALTATAGLAYASRRLVIFHGSEAGTTFAAVTLALYALALTPLASDWMLGQAPGHAVSAVGMMQACSGIAGACALVLILRLGTPALRRDMGKLMIAGALGLGYLAYMDYLITWYGDLPAHVSFYIARTTAPMGLLASGALLAGLAAPVLLLWLWRNERAEPLAGASVLIGLFLFNAWWIAGGIIGSFGGLVLSLVAGTLFRRIREDGGTREHSA